MILRINYFIDSYHVLYHASTYVCTCIHTGENRNTTSYIEVFPYNPDTSSAHMRPKNEPCCNEDSTSSSCSIEYCNCSVKSQVDCYIRGSNLDM